MLTNYTNAERAASAESTLYQFACGLMDTAEAKADLGAYFEALDVVTGEYVELAV